VQIDKDSAKYSPRPIPKCLDDLRRSTEAATGCKFNFCLVNYYASGSDSISYHSDDERFLGELPAIASFSLGARRDFLMKHKPIAPNENAPSPPETKPIKLPLASGDMILMRGTTQANVTNLFLCPIPHVPYSTGRENETYSGLPPSSLPSHETSC
jgi:alkylated DNA repair dioxygenase AlkB